MSVNLVKLEGLLKKPYKFYLYDPYLTYTYEGDEEVFLDNQAKLVEFSRFHDSFYQIGKEAFELLEIKSRDEVQKICKIYFQNVYFLLDCALDLVKEGRLAVNFDGDSDQDGSNYLKRVLQNPKKSELKYLAPTFLGLLKSVLSSGEVFGKDIESAREDFLQHIYFASLAHVLISIDDALFAFTYESLDGIDIEAIRSSSFCLYLAKSINENKDNHKILRVKKARFAAHKRHEKTNSAKQKIVELWASGKYSSRDICAEQECANLNISFSTARKALRNTSDP